MDNLVVLPVTKKQWEHKAHNAVKAQNYEEAVEYYRALVDHGVHSYEIHVYLLVCLMKLHELQQAEQYCELFMDYHEENYHVEFIEFYIMILYEGQQFSRAMKVIQETIAKEDVSEDFVEKYEEIYSICYELNKPMEQAMLAKLDEAIQNEQHQKQWQLLHECIQLGMQVGASLVRYLDEPTVHPVLKTKMLEVVQAHHNTGVVKIEKFGYVRTIQVSQLHPIEDEMGFDKMLQKVQSIEQENPTLFTLVQELMYQYCYVMFPFQMNEVEFQRLIGAFMRVGERHLSLHKAEEKLDAKIELDMENIELCSQLYTHITVQ